MKKTIAFALAAIAMGAIEAAPAGAQNPSTAEDRPYDFYLTPDELRACIVADYEREQLLGLIDARRGDLDSAQSALLDEQETREDYQRVRAHYNAVRENLNDLVFQENALVEILNSDCRKPFYAIDYAAVSEELGFGWTTRWQ